MPKQNKMVCLDEDVVNNLKGKNASQLINDLLKKHFNLEEMKDKPELIMRRIKELELEAEYKAKLKELK